MFEWQERMDRIMAKREAVTLVGGFRCYLSYTEKTEFADHMTEHHDALMRKLGVLRNKLEGVIRANVPAMIEQYTNEIYDLEGQIDPLTRKWHEDVIVPRIAKEKADKENEDS